MSKYISVETVRSLFRIHGYSAAEVFGSPVANAIMQGLIDSQHLTAQELNVAKNAPTDIFLSFKSHIIEIYGDQLSDSDLFAVLEMLEMLSFLVDTSHGLNLPARPVFIFFTESLRGAAGAHTPQNFQDRY